MKKLYLLDAYALIYRGYFPFARNPRINSKGEDTSAVFGFMLTFDEIRRKVANDYLAVVFDPKGPTFRHALYREYKAQREETPPSIRRGVPYIKDIIREMGVKIYEVEGYEADDVIGTIATQLQSDPQAEVYMVTPDKDYGQLVSPGTKMYVPKRGGGFEQMGEQEVCQKYGIRSPKQMIDLLALMGDTSDNVPGCPKVGPSTGAKLLERYEDIDDIYAHAHEIKGKLGENIRNYEEQVRLSLDLVTIRTDVPVDFRLEDCVVADINEEGLKALFEELEFRTFTQKYFPHQTPSHRSDASPISTQPTLFDVLQQKDTSTPSVSLSSTADYRKVEKEDIDKLVSELDRADIFAFDTETEGLDPLTDDIVGVSFSTHTGSGYYLPLPKSQDEVSEILRPFRKVFERKEKVIVGQNLKFDLEVLYRYGIESKAKLFDTMIAHYLINPELPHNMDYMAEHHLGYTPIPITRLIGEKKKEQISMREVPVHKVVEYACEDADITLRLYEYLRPRIEGTHLERLFYEVEMPLLSVLMDMERTGVRVDVKALEDVADDLNGRMRKLEKDIYTAAAKEFNINSPKEVGEVLFDHLKLSDKPRQTKTGNYVTKEEELVKIKDKHPVVEMILRYRGLKKLLSTYVNAFPSMINNHTGRIHTTYNQAVTATGRLSSTNPNLQNIPIRDDDGREIRKAFTPLDPGNEVFVSADYSQIELRLVAHLSQDPFLIEAFRNGQDVHTATASKIYKVPIEQVTREQRRRAKTANFGILYGISAFGLSERLSIPRSEAMQLIQGYFESYPHIKKYMDQSVQNARENGYVETLLGRRRYIQDIHAGNATVRGYAERNAINAPIQGSAADLIKLAMVNISQRIRREKLSTKMILQVHDELNFSVPLSELDVIKSIIKEEMEGVFPSMLVDLTVDIGVGKNWLEAH